MKHYVVTVARFSLVGRIESSTKRFLVSSSDDSFDAARAQEKVMEEVQIGHAEGLPLPVVYSVEHALIGGKLADFGPPWISTQTYEIRKLG